MTCIGFRCRIFSLILYRPSSIQLARISSSAVHKISAFHCRTFLQPAMEGTQIASPNESERPTKRPRIDGLQSQVTESKETGAAASGEHESKPPLGGDAPRRGKGRGRGQKQRSLETSSRREKIAKRKGENGRQETGEGDADGSKAPRLPKRQCAILLGFNGTGFSGMQMCVVAPLVQNLIPSMKIILTDSRWSKRFAPLKTRCSMPW